MVLLKIVQLIARHQWAYEGSTCSWSATKVVGNSSPDAPYYQKFFCNAKAGGQSYDGVACGGWQIGGNCTNCTGASVSLDLLLVHHLAPVVLLCGL